MNGLWLLTVKQGFGNLQEIDISKLFRYPNQDGFITGTRSISVPPNKEKTTKNRHKMLLIWKKKTTKYPSCKTSKIKLPWQFTTKEISNTFCYKPPTSRFVQPKIRNEQHPTCFSSFHQDTPRKLWGKFPRVSDLLGFGRHHHHPLGCPRKLGSTVRISGL